MPIKDTSEIKDKILNIIRINGPCLPVHIAKGVNMSILFTSAFLSELISEKRIKTSHMKVGSSSLHFISGQEPKLENFSQYLKSREKDAYELLRGKKFLKDREQEPAIRVALRAIKDFAIPFTINNENVWRYFTVSESDFIQEKKPEPAPEIIKPEIKEIIPEIKKDKESSAEQENLDIFEKPKKIKKTAKKSSSSQKKNEKFFNKVKEFLSGKSIEIIDIEGFNKNDLTLKVGINGEERLLIAYNKKRIDEQDIIKAGKKASDSNLKYIILSLGEPLRKLSSLIEAVKDLSKIEKIE